VLPEEDISVHVRANGSLRDGRETVDRPRAGEKDLRVLHIVRTDKTVEKFFLPILQEQLKCGQTVDLAIGELEGPSNYCGIVPIRFDLPRNASPLALLRSIAFLRTHIKQQRYDAILAHMPLVGVVGRLAAASALNTRIGYVCHAFGFYPTRGLVARTVYRVLEVCLSQITDSIVVLNEHDWNYVQSSRLAFRNVHKHKLSSVGVDVQWLLREAHKVDPRITRAGLGIPERSRIVSFIGRLIKEKGIRRFLQIIAAMKGDQDAHFLIVGDGPLWQEVSTAVHQLGIRDRVHLLGVRDDVPQLLFVTDVVCLPTENEGSPVVLQEAMVLGAAIVASRVSGCTDVVEHGRTGLLVEIDDIAGYVRAIRTILDDPKVASALKTSAREVANTVFDVRVVAPCWAEAITQIATRPKHSTASLKALGLVFAALHRLGKPDSSK